HTTSLLFLFTSSCPLHAAHSFPTRRSSDLVAKIINAAGTYTVLTASTMPPSVQASAARAAKHPVRLLELQKASGEYLAKRLRCRSEEHTSELQSPDHLVCRLLLEKKKQHNH